ncbi:hemolysin family protein [Pseudorhodoferax soli]|uniref:Putative hemolysin n=1 Tax=Pseudorhodoferax soli TaxID=545864 RepID=A0A368YB41_9BURK|nr:hemolysin family protein [Pseudorhodoferax soli]RCW76057.1 putative hemolysin [Pseudorhodoferax soli]
MDFLLIALLTALNGVFAMSEMALATSRKARLVAMAEGGDKGAAAALTLLTNPTQLLSTVQVGITLIGMLNGILGEAAFSSAVADWLVALGLGDRAADIAATALVVTAITFVTIVFGELVPKRIAQLYPEKVANAVARPMAWVARVAKPFVRLLSLSTQGVLAALRVDTAAARAVTEEEIAASLEEGVDAGVIEAHEHRMVRNLFRLDERPLTSIMVPRDDVGWLDATLPVLDALRLAGGEAEYAGHSWYPVCRGSLEEVVGIVSVARLLALAGQDREALIGAHVLPATFVPETLSGLELLEQFRARAGRMVFVVDEYGVVQGVLTPRDLLEAITGELQPETQTEAWATARGDGSWLLDGLMPIGELKSRLDIDELPEEDRGRYNTVAGLLMAVSGHMPATGERIECAGWVFEVLDLDGRRIDKVLAEALRADEGSAGG